MKRYIYHRMTAADVHECQDLAGLTVEEMGKLFGRHPLAIHGYLDPTLDEDPKKTPTVPESLILEFLADHPEHKPDMLEIVEDMIKGERKPRLERTSRRLRHARSY